jgi:hypothetical protein
MEGIQFNNMHMNPAEMNNMYINGNMPGFQNIGNYLSIKLFAFIFIFKNFLIKFN